MLLVLKDTVAYVACVMVFAENTMKAWRLTLYLATLYGEDIHIELYPPIEGHPPFKAKKFWGKIYLLDRIS